MNFGLLQTKRQANPEHKHSVKTQSTHNTHSTASNEIQNHRLRDGAQNASKQVREKKTGSGPGVQTGPESDEKMLTRESCRPAATQLWAVRLKQRRK